ncbi:hypothetical protein DEH69_03225 [Streptomyces sp. PT12]|nr:hypothetical protein DEH69_03225 [Streptomyces sp. PT12]
MGDEIGEQQLHLALRHQHRPPLRGPHRKRPQHSESHALTLVDRAAGPGGHHERSVYGLPAILNGWVDRT